MKPRSACRSENKEGCHVDVVVVAAAAVVVAAVVVVAVAVAKYLCQARKVLHSFMILPIVRVLQKHKINGTWSQCTKVLVVTLY